MTEPKKDMWEKTKTNSKAGFDKLWALSDKLGAPINRFSNKIGSEALWPQTLDKEADKAARILQSFCKQGFYEEEVYRTADGPKQKQKVLKSIPPEVIRNARGLAIFTAMRTGLWFSGAGGSGLLIGRKPNGEWSPPSGILLHTAGLGFLIGIDIYDCVLVLNTQQAVDAFAKIRVTIGGELSAVAGPVGAGAILDTELHKRQAPIFTYMKSRGFYAGIQVDGTVIIERTDENEKFYLQKLSAQEIVLGKVRHPPYELRTLMETLKAAEGDVNVDETLLPTEPPPADFEVVEEGHLFGIPDQEDPDPYGVLALQKEGLQIKEAGTQRPVSIDQFEFRPSPTGLKHPISRRSTDSGLTRRDSWRQSTTSSMEKRHVMTDTATQTDFDLPVSPDQDVQPLTNAILSPMKNVTPIQLEDNETPAEIHEGAHARPPSKVEESVDEATDAKYDSDDAPDESFEEPIVHEIHQAAAAPQISKARLVTMPRRGPPPALPPRHPSRARVLQLTGVTKDRGTGMSVPSSPKQTTALPECLQSSPPDMPSSPEKELSTNSNGSSLSHDDPSESMTSRATSPSGKAVSFLSVKSELDEDAEQNLFEDIPGAFPETVLQRSDLAKPPTDESTKPGAMEIANADLITSRSRHSTEHVAPNPWVENMSSVHDRPASMPDFPAQVNGSRAKVSMADLRRKLEEDISPGPEEGANATDFTTVHL